MSDFSTQLRTYIEKIDPLFDPEDLIVKSQVEDIETDRTRTALRTNHSAPSTRRGMRPVWAFALGAGLVFTMGGLALLVGGGPKSSDVYDAAVEANVAPYSWAQVETPRYSAPYLYFDGVIGGGPGFIAVGSGDPGVWISSDGSTWVEADVESSGWLFDVIAADPGFIAVGSDGAGAIVLLSDDGTSWTSGSTDSVPGDEMIAVTAGGPGFVAVGTHIDGPAVVWTSTDGKEWSRVPHDPEVFGRDAAILDVADGPGGLVAVGVAGDRDLTAAVWTSSDGLAWTRVPHDPTVFGDGTVAETEMLSVAVGGPGYVAVSGIGDQGHGVWTSADGTTWSKVALDPDVFSSDEEMTVIVNTPAGLVAAGYEGEDAAAWLSSDGDTWSRIEHEGVLGGPGQQRITDLAATDSGLIAVGSDSGSEGVWLAEDHT
ncbi:MAG: hypothetical protein PVJ28_06865 [Acidimicrobiia bacterium]|jgi:hypothetical protein